MMRTLCYSVRLQSLTSISEKCCKAVSFDGRESLIPKSQIHGQDYDINKSEAYWISAWILEKKDIQYSSKKQAYFDSESGNRLPDIKIEKHVPKRIEPITIQADENLTR